MANTIDRPPGKSRLGAWFGFLAALFPSARLKAKLRVTEQALTHNTEVLSSMVSALPVGVVSLDRRGRVEIWNDAAQTILGYSAAEMIGTSVPPTIFLPAPGSSGPADLFLRMVTGQKIMGEEVQCRRKDGSIVEASFSGAPLIRDGDRTHGAVCVFEDISQRNAIARQLFQAQKMEAVGQLTGGVAHDFNNILGVAIGNLDLLEEEMADRPDTLEMIRLSLGALLRGAELTRALLAFSRRQPLRPSLVQLDELLSNTVRVLARTLGEHVEVRLTTAPYLWATVVDAAQLESAVTNLAINARDAMPGGGKLTISAANTVLDEDSFGPAEDVRPGDYVAVEVSDTGHGMTPEVIAHAFEPFFTTKPVGRGTGLGLSMVYGFTRQSGGHVKIYSEPEIGTTIRLYLPRAPLSSDAEDQASRLAEPVMRGTETILVVDDNAEVRAVVERQLISLGYRVVLAEHGPQALGFLRSHDNYDLLFTDVVMPHGMSGLDLAVEAMKLRPRLKVLFTSGFPGTMVPPPSAFQGHSNFIGKPYRRQELARLVRELLDVPAEETSKEPQ